MSIIDFFGRVVKPIKLRGAGVLNPALTAVIDDRLSCIRELDVNLWFYRTSSGIVAIDTGYANFQPLGGELAAIGVNPAEVTAVLLTHADMDHAGTICDGCADPFVNASVYLHEREEGMLNGTIDRFRFGSLRFRNPIRRSGEYMLLKDGQSLRFGDTTVRVLHTPGHTPGHCAYVFDGRVLFTGDCLAVNAEGGYCFFPLFNMDTPLNLRSLQKLRDAVRDMPLEIACTGHSGWTRDIDGLFRHIGQKARGTRRRPFDPRAPRDVFRA